MRLKRMMMVLIAVIFCCITVAAQVSGPDAQGAIRRGNENYARGEYAAAIQEYRKIQADAGEIYAQSLYNIGVCNYELGRTADAVGMYQRAIDSRGGQYPKALYALGVALETSNRLDEAKDAYARAIAVSEGRYTEAGFAVAHYRLALLEGRAGDYERAAALFREAIANSRRRFPAGHNNLGVMLALAGQTAEALREFEIAVRQSTGSFDEAAYNLKLCRAQLTKEKQNAYASLKVSDSTFVLTK
ncbi:MAG: tetratricopeptide repeat protein [Acidobacteria bacterium]|nr:tetratricopeptide repeat protein [Acidobacteriota bacterium]